MTNYTDTIESMFHEDVRDKKRTAMGIHGRSRGGSIRLPVESLRGQEKRRYQKGGKVVNYNMNVVMPYIEFRALTEDDQRRLLTYWRNNLELSNNAIMKEWDISTSAYYRIYNPLDIPITNPKVLEQMAAGEKIRQAVKERNASMTDEEKKEAAKVRAQSRLENKEAKKKQQAAAAEKEAKQKERLEKKLETLKNELAEAREASELAQKQAEERIQQAIGFEREQFEKERTAFYASVQSQPQQQSRLTSVASGINSPDQLSGVVIDYVPAPEIKQDKLAFHLDIEGEGSRNIDRMNRLLSFLKEDNGYYRIIVQVEELA